LKGIDIYSGSNITSWASIKAAGVEAVMIKATEGVTYVNDKLDAHYKGAKAAGLLVGFYHFAKSNPVQAEFNHFRDAIKDYKQDLRPCLDYEVEIPDLGFIKEFMAQNSNLIFYSNHSIADVCNISNADIWIAEPNTSPANTKTYAAIQTNFHGCVNGLNGDSDIDMFSNLMLNDGVKINNIAGSVASMMMRNGESSRRVSLLQAILNVVFTGSIKNIDGNFGPITLALVDRYQKAMGLPVTGFVDTATITMLLTDLKNNYFKI